MFCLLMEICCLVGTSLIHFWKRILLFLIYLNSMLPLTLNTLSYLIFISILSLSNRLPFKYFVFTLVDIDMGDPLWLILGILAAQWMRRLFFIFLALLLSIFTEIEPIRPHIIIFYRPLIEVIIFFMILLLFYYVDDPFNKYLILLLFALLEMIWLQ